MSMAFLARLSKTAVEAKEIPPFLLKQIPEQYREALTDVVSQARERWRREGGPRRRLPSKDIPPASPAIVQSPAVSGEHVTLRVGQNPEDRAEVVIPRGDIETAENVNDVDFWGTGMFEAGNVSDSAPGSALIGDTLFVEAPLESSSALFGSALSGPWVVSSTGRKPLSPGFEAVKMDVDRSLQPAPQSPTRNEMTEPVNTLNANHVPAANGVQPPTEQSFDAPSAPDSHTNDDPIPAYGSPPAMTDSKDDHIVRVKHTKKKAQPRMPLEISKDAAGTASPKKQKAATRDVTDFDYSSVPSLLNARPSEAEKKKRKKNTRNESESINSALKSSRDES